MVLLLLLLTRAWALLPECPAAACASLGYDICASFDGFQVYFNTANCTESLHCSLYSTLHWVQLRTEAGDDEGTLPCQATAFTPAEALYSATEVTCGQRDKQQTLSEGAYPKVCASSMDCALSNGEFSNCACGLDGKAYCEAAWGSQVMEGFWEECNNSTNLIDSDRYQYWREYLRAYVLTASKPPCASGLFDELQYLAGLNDTAGWLGLALTLLLA